mmetsp:Transcript_7883/g.23184  ORF Transcript_7883/g.23184 Transcript_7883/m.23184 type:complete len:533 (+) Transcript_7883:113-1711(+)
MSSNIRDRHVASRSVPSAPSSDGSPLLLPSDTTRKSKNVAKGKGKKGSNVFLYVLGFVVVVWVGVAFSVGTLHQQQRLDRHETIPYAAANVRKPRQLATTQQHRIGNKIVQKIVNNHKSTNPYEGWQPVTDPRQDRGNKKCTSWRSCLVKDHDCPSKCRDSIDDFGEAPPRPGFTPDPHGDSEDNNEKAQAVEWIPDVTVLRRMLEAGKDEHGNPWPPPLVTETDQELCEEIGVSGGRADQNIVALNAVPIRGMDMLGRGIDYSTKKMKRAPKILCMVYTMKENHHTNIRAIRETWGPGCDGFLAFSTRDDPRLPAISLPHDGREEYNNMWQKVRSIWRFVGTHYLDDFDFFFQGGEDLYVLPQNLRSYLADAIEDPSGEDFFGGRRFQQGQNSNIFFNSGGAGYALSRATVKKFVETGLDDERCFPHKHSAMEDVFIARCLKDVFDIDLVDTRDDEDRERFHPFSPGSHYTWEPPTDGKRDWYEAYNTLWPPKLKEECCAPDSVSFHYMKKPTIVRHIHSILYFCDRFKQR